jgi:hypothetical protein
MFNYYANSMVETIQTGKKYFVDAFVKNEDVKKALTQFVDAQTAYTKSAIDAGLTFGTNMSMLFTNQKFYQDLAENYKSLVPAYNVTSKTKKEK